ncbi:ABC transporter permease [Verrucomicrobium spinosum]|uniref:ABC transporter permease n=1 Tax=Verrucomicrobium spinosum TaxID=2736 RepID=UPI000AB18011|nr:hypothetical protein [Verrucomicrobium spinosum]
MSPTKNIIAVFKREFFSYFNSPLAYIILFIFVIAAMGFTFIVGGFLSSNNATLSGQGSFFMWHPWIYLVLVPAVGMRLWSEEQRLGTMELLATMPISRGMPYWQVPCCSLGLGHRSGTDFSDHPHRLVLGRT